MQGVQACATMPGDDLLPEMFGSFIFNVIIHTVGVNSRHSTCFLTLNF